MKTDNKEITLFLSLLQDSNMTDVKEIKGSVNVNNSVARLIFD